MSEIQAVARAGKRKRDALGQLCFALHLGVMVFIVVGWALPQPVALIAYLVFLPAVVVQWQFNKNSCVLNNVESLLRTGRWRDSGNAEEGAWLLGLARSVLRLELKPAYLDVFVYVILGLFWCFGMAHLLRGYAA